MAALENNKTLRQDQIQPFLDHASKEVSWEGAITFGQTSVGQIAIGKKSRGMGGGSGISIGENR